MVFYLLLLKMEVCFEDEFLHFIYVNNGFYIGIYNFRFRLFLKVSYLPACYTVLLLCIYVLKLGNYLKVG